MVSKTQSVYHMFLPMQYPRLRLVRLSRPRQPKGSNAPLRSPSKIKTATTGFFFSNPFLSSSRRAATRHSRRSFLSSDRSRDFTYKSMVLANFGLCDPDVVNSVPLNAPDCTPRGRVDILYLLVLPLRRIARFASPVLTGGDWTFPTLYSLVTTAQIC